MKIRSSLAVAFARVMSATPARAHPSDPGRIEISCRDGDAVRRSDIAHAVARSRYWATPSAREVMFGQARRRCALGANSVTFVPAQDERSTRSARVF